MKITNRYNLPEAFVKAVENNEKMEDNEIRVTQLLNGLRAVELMRRYGDEIEVDVAEMIWMIFGTATHAVLENTEKSDGEFREERLKMPIGGAVLTGKSDVYKDGIITDYKTCSVWKVIKEDFEDWEKQLRLYTLLWKSVGCDVKGCRIVAMMKDHSKTKAKLEADYPDLPVAVIEFEFTDEEIEETRSWAEGRINELLALRNVPDAKLPLCTPEERFNDGDKYAVMKNGRKRAIKLFDNYDDAVKACDNGLGDYVETRKGTDVKCLDYCMVRSVCPYAQSLKGE